MKRILFLNPDRGHTCSFYRSGGIAKDLRRQLGDGYFIDVACWADIATDWQTISNYDIIMLQRPYHKTAVDFCLHVKLMNVKLWLDYDDNMFAVTPENRAWPIFNDPEIQLQVKAMLEIADVVTVTNEDLKQCYLQFNKNIVVVPNAFNDKIFNVDRVVEERNKKVVWRGSDTHIFDIMNYAPAINKSTTEFPNYEFNYIGYHPWFLEQHENVIFIRAMDVVDYYMRGVVLKPTVVQIPLHDNLFNRCKSNIAFIEGSFWGAVCIVPDFWGDLPGTLSYSTQAEYQAALDSVLSGEVDVVAQNKLAWDYIKANLLLSGVNKIRVNIVRELIGDEQ